METTIWKNGQLIGESPTLQRATTAVPFNLDLFYLQTLTLAAPAVFDHLAGRGLSFFLDKCGLIVGDERHEPLRYVHGRSEVSRGKSSVTSVLLAKIAGRGEIEEHTWLPMLPAIYKEFLRLSRKG